ncbi:response regulator [Flavobacterium mesophilum]|uniref:response regulator n=1 Tax=Flavobacterium mesophilum TaxID=3143495 RepID=UPI0031D1BA63
MLQQQNSHKVICLADDDEDDRMLFFDAIGELGLSVQVEEAEDGQVLLDILKKSAKRLPEIVFLDINMPGKSGLDCLREIRNAEGLFQAVKVVMLSTSSSIANIELSYDLGADFYAVKPSTFQGLKDLLHDMLTLDWRALPRSRTNFVLTEKQKA